MQERHLKIVIIFVALSGLLFHYQNCGSTGAQQNTDTDLNAGPIASPELGIINPVNTGSIQFLQSKAEIDDRSTQIVAYGVCAQEQEGALLSWRLSGEDASIISSGKSLCDRGTFEVVYNEASSLECDSTIQLTAFLGSQEKTELSVEKRCQ